jgi:sulfite exporter TauE/SafE
MCGGFAATVATRPVESAAWHAGRLTTYAALGAVAGAFGRVIPGPAWLPAAVGAVLLTWFALAIAGVVPEPRVRVPGIGRAGIALAGRTGLGPRFLFGMTTGLLPCGLVYSALALPVALAHPAAGALAMLAFGTGTVPALATLSAGLQRVLRRGVWPRRALAAVILVAGLWSIALRGGLAGRGPHVHAPAGADAGAAAGVGHGVH